MTGTRRNHLKKITRELVLDLKATPSLPTSQRGCQEARCHNWKDIIQSFTSESHECLWKRTKKKGCWKELNCLISIPTLNIYLKVKLKPLQKLKTGCVNTMLSIYNDPQGQASPTKVLKNSLGTWIKDPRSSELGFREHAESPRKDLWWLSSYQWCLPLQLGWAQEDSAAPLPPRTAGTRLIPTTRWVTPATLWALQNSVHYRDGTWLSRKNDAFGLAMLEAWLMVWWRRRWPPLRQKPAVDHQSSFLHSHIRRSQCNEAFK